MRLEGRRPAGGFAGFGGAAGGVCVSQGGSWDGGVGGSFTTHVGGQNPPMTPTPCNGRLRVGAGWEGGGVGGGGSGAASAAATESKSTTGGQQTMH